MCWNLIWKSPRFVQFSANLTHFWPQSDIPIVSALVHRSEPSWVILEEPCTNIIQTKDSVSATTAAPVCGLGHHCQALSSASCHTLQHSLPIAEWGARSCKCKEWQLYAKCGSDWSQMGHSRDLFQIRYEKVTDLSPLGPIWTTFGPNLATLDFEYLCLSYWFV